jgi:hypothetical protein
MHLLSCTKKSFSAKELQRELGHNRYQPIWEMAHKIRSIMGLRDDKYQLGNEIELDDGFFETVCISKDVDKPLKRGRGSQRQTTVMVLAESREVELTDLNKKHKHQKKFGFLKMKVISRGFSSDLFTPIVSVQSSTENSTELSVYPNPTRGKVHIAILGGELSKVRDIYLMDFLGHKIPLNKTNLLTTKTIDLSEMQKGVYMLFVEMNDARHSQKLVLY